MPLDKKDCSVGMLVQDSNGNVGTIRWIGRMEKAAKPPNNDVGTYCAVEFAPNESAQRTNGTWAGTKYCEAPAGSVWFTKPNKLEKEMNTEGIKAVRDKLGDQVKDWSDARIVKFLIARKYEIPKVLVMITDHIKWRESFKPSSDEFFPPEMVNDYPLGFGEGLDRDGCLIYFERPGNGGKCHPKDFVKRFGIPRISRWHACMMEEGTERLKAHPTATRVTTVVDLSNLGDSDRQVINFGKAIAKIDQDNYPEHLNKMFIINAPGVFTGLWRLIRMFVDDRTKAKIHVLGKDYKDTVAQQIEPKYWPSFMGGTNDSWLHKGGISGSNDPSKARDPASGGVVIEDDNDLTDEQIAAAAAASPAAATPTSKAE